MAQRTSAHANPAAVAKVDDIDAFDTLIDVRSPSEFALDHIPGAVNYPVLDDEQRARIGTLYTQVSPFAARRLGAVLVARNIAQHMEAHLLEHPKQWKPLVYCWRGGQRSGAMATVLAQVGWAARQLEGGYRFYRRQVIADLDRLPDQFDFLVLHGPTGSGKTAILEALQELGGQVLDLEAIACHRGSVLGAPALDAGPTAQPGQRAFETRIWDCLRRLDPGKPVFVESESRRIGRLSIPDALFSRLLDSRCLRVAAPLEARVAHLLQRYSDIYADPQALRDRLDFFVQLHGRKIVDRWRAWVDARSWDDLTREIVTTHYDPAYHRGGNSLYRRAQAAQVLELGALDRDAIIGAAGAILRNSGTRNAN